MRLNQLKNLICIRIIIQFFGEFFDQTDGVEFLPISIKKNILKIQDKFFIFLYNKRNNKANILLT